MTTIESADIELIVGLGNPGKEYESTRHNAGFLAVDELARYLKISEFKYNKRFQSETAEIQFQNKLKIILAKPQTFINKSGLAAASLSKYLKIKPENILIVHDDIDIGWGEYKFSFGRSSAGHKGIESIIKALKTKNFWRLRIGICPVRQARGKPTKKIKADKIILKKFTEEELKTLGQTIKNPISTLTRSWIK